METSHRPVTQRDVAQALGLTQSTVSLALKKDIRIPLDRRREIEAKAHAMGYRVSAAASALAIMRHSHTEQTRFTTLAWLDLWPQTGMLRKHKEFDEYFHGASEAADKLGYHLDEFQTGETMKPQRLDGILKARGIRGVLIPPHKPDAPFQDFNWSDYASIKFGRSLAFPRSHAVSSDQLQNTVLAYHEVSKRGYKRIGFINESVDAWLFDAGYLKAQQTLPPAERLPVLNIGTKDPASHRPAILSWINKYRPDAIITGLPDLPQKLIDMGFRIPEDFGVATTSVLDGGVDAGIHQNPREIGRVAALSLVSLLHDNDYGIPDIHREVLVKGKWVDGSSLPSRV